MADRAVARRYAEAFVGVLEGSNRVEPGLEDLRFVVKTYSDSKDLQRFLGSPEIGDEDKGRLLTRLWSGLSGPEVNGLLQLLLKWDRIDHLPVIREEAVSVAEHRRGLLRGSVITAHPISSVEAGALVGAVENLLGKRVVLERRVDSQLIGGGRITVGTLLLDGSIQTFLHKIRQQLLESKAV